MSEGPASAERQAFLEGRRWSAQGRYDAEFAAGYDQQWSEVSPSHAAFVARFLELVRPGGLVLDMPCGTGKYWPLIETSGCSVVGLDQSVGMLAIGRAKHPAVPVGRATMQEFDYDATFDGVMCMDSMEFVGPEHWPGVLARLRDAGRMDAPLYLTVEIADEDELAAYNRKARAAGYPVMPRESFDPEGGGYHHHPERETVMAWLREAGLDVVDEGEGDGYWHLLLRRGT